MLVPVNDLERIAKASIRDKERKMGHRASILLLLNTEPFDVASVITKFATSERCDLTIVEVLVKRQVNALFANGILAVRRGMLFFPDERVRANLLADLMMLNNAECSIAPDTPLKYAIAWGLNRDPVDFSRDAAFLVTIAQDPVALELALAIDRHDISRWLKAIIRALQAQPESDRLKLACMLSAVSDAQLVLLGLVPA
jgi:hypothetical protein